MFGLDERTTRAIEKSADVLEFEHECRENAKEAMRLKWSDEELAEQAEEDAADDRREGE